MKKLTLLLLAFMLALPAYGQTMRSASIEITRPADTTAYAARDVISNSTSAPAAINFENLARRAGESGYIVKARLLTNQSTNTSRYRLHLFRTSPTAINDNSPYTMLYANRVNRIGFIDFAAVSTSGTGSDAAHTMNAEIRIPFIAGDAVRSVYAILETLDAFTPASGQKFFIALTADVN